MVCRNINERFEVYKVDNKHIVHYNKVLNDVGRHHYITMLTKIHGHDKILRNCHHHNDNTQHTKLKAT